MTKSKGLALSKSKGFTLIELLVVIAIIAILAVVILAALSQARKAARDAKRAETTRNVMTAVETYRSVVGNTPAVIGDLVPTYLSAVPDPIYFASYTYTAATDSYCALSTTYEAKDVLVGTFYAKDGVAAYNPAGGCL